MNLMNILWLVVAFGLGYETKARFEPWLERKRAYRRRVATRKAKKTKGEANAQNDG